MHLDSLKRLLNKKLSVCFFLSCRASPLTLLAPAVKPGLSAISLPSSLSAHPRTLFRYRFLINIHPAKALTENPWHKATPKPNCLEFFPRVLCTTRTHQLAHLNRDLQSGFDGGSASGEKINYPYLNEPIIHQN
jgi:hypothetical protein